MLSKLRKAWSLADAASKTISLAKKETQRDLRESYIMRAAMEVERLKGMIEEIAREIKR
jgi:hypothetical protein